MTVLMVLSRIIFLVISNIPPGKCSNGKQMEFVSVFQSVGISDRRGNGAREIYGKKWIIIRSVYAGELHPLRTTRTSCKFYAASILLKDLDILPFTVFVHDISLSLSFFFSFKAHAHTNKLFLSFSLSLSLSLSLSVKHNHSSRIQTIFTEWRRIN